MPASLANGCALPMPTGANPRTSLTLALPRRALLCTLPQPSVSAETSVGDAAPQAVSFEASSPRLGLAWPRRAVEIATKPELVTKIAHPARLIRVVCHR